MTRGKKVIIFPWRPRVNASARHRIYQYLPLLSGGGMDIRVCPPSPEVFFLRCYKGGGSLGKVLYLVAVFFTRCYQVLVLSRPYRVVFIQRELLPLGPPLLEWILHRMGKRIVYDFDDALFLRPPYVPRGFRSWIHAYGKVGRIIGWSSTVIAGNAYLAAYARRYCGDVRIVPTVPGMGEEPLREGGDRKVAGWTGTAGNLVHLRSISDALALLKGRFGDLEVQVISDGHFVDPRFDTVNYDWRMDSEREIMRRFTVGLAPLLDVPYSEGKCGFKVLRYMKAGVPVVCSAVGVHREIVRDGENGFLCGDTAEWVEKISLLLTDADLRDRFREAGYGTLESEYSFDRCAREIEGALNDLLAGQGK